MKTLTVRSPWGQLIVSGHKTVECRTRPTSFRGRLLIHSGTKTWQEPRPGYLDLFFRTVGVRRPADVFSALLGTVEVTGCVPRDRWGELSAAARAWTVPGYDWVWVLADPRPFPQPIPYRDGKLGLFDVPDAIVSAARNAGVLTPASPAPNMEIG